VVEEEEVELMPWLVEEEEVELMPWSRRWMWS
jgi:hypothetical protein